MVAKWKKAVLFLGLSVLGKASQFDANKGDQINWQQLQSCLKELFANEGNGQSSVDNEEIVRQVANELEKVEAEDRCIVVNNLLIDLLGIDKWESLFQQVEACLVFKQIYKIDD